MINGVWRVGWLGLYRYDVRLRRLVSIWIALDMLVLDWCLVSRLRGFV